MGLIDRVRKKIFPPKQRGRGRPRLPMRTRIRRRIEKLFTPKRGVGERGPDKRPRKTRYDIDLIRMPPPGAPRVSPTYGEIDTQDDYIPEPDGFIPFEEREPIIRESQLQDEEKLNENYTEEGLEEIEEEDYSEEEYLEDEEEYPYEDEQQGQEAQLDDFDREEEITDEEIEEEQKKYEQKRLLTAQEEQAILEEEQKSFAFEYEQEQIYEQDQEKKEDKTEENQQQSESLVSPLQNEPEKGPIDEKQPQVNAIKPEPHGEEKKKESFGQRALTKTKATFSTIRNRLGRMGNSIKNLFKR